MERAERTGSVLTRPSLFCLLGTLSLDLLLFSFCFLGSPPPISQSATAHLSTRLSHFFLALSIGKRPGSEALDE